MADYKVIEARRQLLAIIEVQGAAVDEWQGQVALAVNGGPAVFEVVEILPTITPETGETESFEVALREVIA